MALVTFFGCSTPDNSEPPAELTDIQNPEPVYQLWSRDSGVGHAFGYFNIRPLVIDNRLLTIDVNGVVSEFDPEKGKILWSYETGLKTLASLEGDRRSLVVTSSDGNLALFELGDSSLRLLWKVNIKSEIRARAVASGNRVFVRSVDGRLTALDKSNGAVLWSANSRVPALSLTGSSHPMVYDDLVISGFDDGKLVAFEVDTGAMVWEAVVTRPTGRSEIERLVDLDGQFVIRDGVIYVSSYQGDLAAVAAESGQVIWSRKFSSFKAMDIDENSLYLTDDRSHIWSVDRRTGSALWKQDVLNARKVTGPKLLADKLVVADLEGYVHWFEKQDGNLVSRVDTTTIRYLSQPVTLGSTLFVQDSLGQLTALTQKR